MKLTWPNMDSGTWLSFQMQCHRDRTTISMCSAHTLTFLLNYFWSIVIWPTILKKVNSLSDKSPTKSQPVGAWVCFRGRFFEQKLMFSSNFRCDQIIRNGRYDFGHTLLCCLSHLDVQQTHLRCGFVEHLSRT